MTTPLADRIERAIERVAYFCAGSMAKEAIDGIRAGQWQWRADGGIHRDLPYPMGFYLNDPNLYYARGWGCHIRPTPLSRWLLRRTAIRARTLKDEGTS